MLRFLKIRLKPESAFDFCGCVWILFYQGKLINGLCVIRNRSVAVNCNCYRSHSEETERNQTEREHRRINHIDVQSVQARKICDCHKQKENHSLPERAEISGNKSR